MAQTEGLQVRVARIANLAAKYTLETSVSARGDLPDTFVFVKQVVDSADPTTDTFLRIATSADLAEVTRDRVTAIRQGTLIFRDAVLVLTYDSVAEGVAAGERIIELINELVVEYQSYLTDFYAPAGEFFSLPNPDAGQLTPLITAYTAKVEEREAQQTALTEMTAECSELDTAYSTLQAEVTLIDEMRTTLFNASETLNASLVAFDTLLQAAQTEQGAVNSTLDAWEATRTLFVSDTAPRDTMDTYLQRPSGVLPVAASTFGGALGNSTAVRQGLGTAASLLTVERTELEATYATKSAELAAALEAKNTCAVSVTQANAVLAQLQREEAQLLVDIQALCPDYAGA